MDARDTRNTPDVQSLKAACGALVKAVGGVEAAEGFCRSKFRRLSEYGRPENDSFMPVDVIADLEAVAHGTAGYPQVTTVLARRAGFALVRLPDTADRGIGNLHALLAQASTDSAKVITGTLHALADDMVTPAEASPLRLQCIQAAEDFMRFAALLEQISGES